MSLIQPGQADMVSVFCFGGGGGSDGCFSPSLIKSNVSLAII